MCLLITFKTSKIFTQVIIKQFNHIFLFTLNDNLTSVLLAGPAIQPVLPLAKFNFDILVLPEEPVLHSIAGSDTSICGAKKDDKIWLIGS